MNDNIWRTYRRENRYEICASNSYQKLIAGKNHQYSVNLQTYSEYWIFMNASNGSPVEDSDEQRERITFLSEDRQKPVVNALFHYMAELDMLNSYDRRERSKRVLYGKLQEGVWGERIRKEFHYLAEPDQDKILYWMSRKEEDTKKDFYEEVLTDCFDETVTYFDTRDRQLLIMTIEQENAYNSGKYRLIQELFKDLLLEDRIYWSCRPIILEETKYRLGSESDREYYNLI